MSDTEFTIFDGSEEYASLEITPNIDNDIHFYINGEEVLKLCEDGNIYVKGRLAESDKEIAETIAQWVKQYSQHLNQ